MDLSFRASTIHSSTHLSSLHASRLHSEKFSVYNYTDDDEDAQSLFRCPFCDFEIEFSVLRSRLLGVHSYGKKIMVCPVCDEKLGEDATGHSSSEKLSWKSEKSSKWHGNSARHDEKLAARGDKHDPLLSPFINNASVSNSSGIQSDDDSIISDISKAESYGTDVPDVVDNVKDHEEKMLRASFLQQLVVSTLF